MIDLHNKTMTQLCDMVSSLEEERDHYKRELGLAQDIDKLSRLKSRFKLTTSEANTVMALYQRAGRTITKDNLLDALYAGIDEADIKIIDVFICKARKKVGGSAVIATDWGVGYHLTPAGVELIGAALLPGSC